MATQLSPPLVLRRIEAVLADLDRLVDDAALAGHPAEYSIRGSLSITQLLVYDLPKAIDRLGLGEPPALPDLPIGVPYAEVDRDRRHLRSLLAWLRERVPADTSTENDGGGPWSRPDTPKRWALKFAMNERTFKRHCKSGRIRHKKLSDRLYMVALDNLPAARG